MYTPKQIESIEMHLLALLSYVKRLESKPLPRAFQFLETIIQNIDICRKHQYADIEELSKLIKQDFNSAMDIHCGLPEYYISNEHFMIQESVNETIHQELILLNGLIMKKI